MCTSSSAGRGGLPHPASLRLQNKHREHLAREHALAVKTQRLEMTVSQ